jgi:hypothetical protein
MMERKPLWVGIGLRSVKRLKLNTLGAVFAAILVLTLRT